METVQLLNIVLVVIIFAIFVLAMIALLIIYKIRSKNAQEEEIIQGAEGTKKNEAELITRKGVGINSIYQFMEFDAIIDNMIVRKNRQQYVMVIQCKGINYDLLSEEEKSSIEQGFMELLNTLRFPIQLYVQTRTFNLTDLLKEYARRNEDVKDQIDKLDMQVQEARRKNDDDLVDKLQFERRRKQNIYEYGESIEEYTSKISESRNILQQKTFIVLSYFSTEYGDISKYSKEELDDIAFGELYTRAQTVISALTSAEVAGTVLSSEELGELLYVAYNRDESETYTLKNALDAQYDRLYSTARDIMEERKRRIEEQIEEEASRVAAKSILKADEMNRAQKAAKIKQRAKEMVDEYKSELSKPLYEETKRQIDQADIDELIEDEKPKRRIVRKKV